VARAILDDDEVKQEEDEHDLGNDDERSLNDIRVKIENTTDDDTDNEPNEVTPPPKTRKRRRLKILDDDDFE
jgi:hypothetical protein